MLIRNAELAGQQRDLRIAAGRIAEIATALPPRPDEPVVDAAGGALLPGLHDHHIHLFALAAARRSVRCGPPEVRTEEELRAALHAATPEDGWIRGVAYHESVAGDLDAERLQALAPPRPVRVQHRSGAQWILSRSALARLAETGPLDHAGLERDARGAVTGRLLRGDAWLRERLGGEGPPSLDEISRELARCGVTGLTDATPDNGPDAAGHFAAARRRGELRQKLCLLGRHDLPEPAAPDQRGAVKLVLDEFALPALDAFAGELARAHAAERNVAIHCVTRSDLLFALAAFDVAGARPGDRIEHASVTPTEALERIAALGLTVVTQPHFISERGDAYRRDVDPRDLPCLYRGAGFRERGIPLGAGSDAPYGEPDPWAAMRAAVTRRTREGHVLGTDEALAPEAALALFTTPAHDPGGAPRVLRPGAVADLCLLDRPWRDARRDLDARQVAASWCDGQRIA